jgi:hypothetical protein
MSRQEDTDFGVGTQNLPGTPAVSSPGDNRAELQTALDALVAFNAELDGVVQTFITTIQGTTDAITLKEQQATANLEAKRDDALRLIETTRDGAIRAVQSATPAGSTPQIGPHPNADGSSIQRSPWANLLNLSRWDIR